MLRARGRGAAKLVAGGGVRLRLSVAAPVPNLLNFMR